MKTYDIHLVIGNTLIVLKGAEGYSVSTTATQPQLSAKAPKGGRTIYEAREKVEVGGLSGQDTETVAAVTIHEITSDQMEVADQKAGEATGIETQPSGEDTPGKDGK